MSYCVYLLTLGSGKCYVGLTGDLGRRLKEHVSSPQYLVGSAVKKHGIAFHEVLGEFATLPEAASFEVKEIERRSTLTPGGYNITRGGQGHAVSHSQETCAKLSKIAKERMADPEKRRVLSESRLLRLAEDPRFLEQSRRSAARMRESLDRDSHNEMLRSQASRAAHARWEKYRKERRR